MDVCIRKAVADDLDRIMDIFDEARSFMARSGNPTQWGDGYPTRGLVGSDIKSGHCYVCCTGEGSVVATFCVFASPEPNYATLYGGHWIDDGRYHVIHRIASDGSIGGVGRYCMEWCVSKFDNLRIDTHEDNAPMRKIIDDFGFKKCGRILMPDGSWRIAYQRVE